MRKWLTVVALLIFLCAGREAAAVWGAADEVPGATLLFPYFEVDLDNTYGTTTLLAIENASATAIMAHVTLWTDVGIATQAFDVYLTGYDVQTVNLQDIFVRGVFPRTASAGQDPGDRISPHGQLSQDINYPGCPGLLPYPTMPVYLLADLQAVHLGNASTIRYPGLCAGFRHGDRIARGYITVDTVNQCSWTLPIAPGYFVSGGSGTATNQNVLHGDWMIVHQANNFTFADKAIPIEVPAYGATQPSPGTYTFYARLLAGSAADGREPLPTAWAVGTMGQDGPMARQTEYIAWRDPGVMAIPFPCVREGPVSYYPLNQTQVVVFDAESNGTEIGGGTTTFFPLMAARVDASDPADFTLPPRGGWLFANLNATVPGEVTPAGIKQSWMTVFQTFEGRFSTGWSGTVLGSAGAGDNPVLAPAP